MSDEHIGLKRIHHIELWVGNAKQADFFYRKAFGFSRVAYAGLETGQRHRTSYVLRQGNIELVISSALEPDSPLAEFQRQHGDGVRDVAFAVDDVDRAFELAVARGAVPEYAPRDFTDDHGTVRRAAIRTYGDTIHSLIDTRGYDGPFLPGYAHNRIDEPDMGLLVVDHVVGNVPRGQMTVWADFYTRVFGFERYISFDDKDISTEYTALMSVVMSDEQRIIKFPINEPAEGRRTSQIQEYLDYNGAPGVQHVALLTADLIQTTTALVNAGVEFLDVPDSYYEPLLDRVGPIDEAVDELRPLGILVDRDDRGYLLQLFTRPVQDRPTLFYEIIQRKGARGFGKGNFKALFESIEREQARRGNL